MRVCKWTQARIRGTSEWRIVKPCAWFRRFPRIGEVHISEWIIDIYDIGSFLLLPAVLDLRSLVKEPVCFPPPADDKVWVQGLKELQHS